MDWAHANERNGIVSELVTCSQEAANITHSLREEYVALSSGWLGLARKVQSALDRRVPAALGMGVREWLEKTFDRSSTFLLSQIGDLRALQGVPEEIAGQISEYNAHQLTRLPEKDRQDPEILKAAVNDQPTEFRKLVTEIRKKKYNIEPDQWKTIARPLPAELVERWELQEKRIAAALGIRLPKPEEELRAWKAAQIQVWEWLITAMEHTNHWQLHCWIHDEDPNEKEPEG